MPSSNICSGFMANITVAKVIRSDLEDGNYPLGIVEKKERRLNHGELPHNLRLPTS